MVCCSKDENWGVQSMFLYSNAFLIKNPTPPPLLFNLEVWTKEKPSGVNSCRKSVGISSEVWVQHLWGGPGHR